MVDDTPMPPKHNPALRQPRGLVRSFFTFVAALLVFALAGTVIYLISDRNRGQYRLIAQSGTLAVQQGRFLPLGFETYEPEIPALRNAYAPIPLPPAEAFGESESFNDRADLDRALFALLAGWARERLLSEDAGDFELAVTFVQRSELLPGLSEGQRTELRILRGDLAYRNARRKLTTVAEQLRKALDEFKLSLKLGTSHPNDAQRWIDDIKRRVVAYNASTSSKMEPEPPPALRSQQPPKPTEPPAREPEAEEDGATRWRL